MTHAVVGVFHTKASAEHAVADLIKGGFPRERVRLISPQSPQAAHVEVAGEKVEHAEDLAIGALGGALVGSVVGTLVGSMLAAFPGFNELVTASPLAAIGGSYGAIIIIGAVLGAILGAVLGAVSWAGLTRAEAHAYEELLRHGDTLVMVEASDDKGAQAVAILREDGADEAELSEELRHAGMI